MTEGHGDDLYKYEGRIRHNFSSNIYARADLGMLKEHLAGHLGLIEHYPEPEPWSLERLVADEGGTDITEVMVTNGATEAIYLVARFFCSGMHGRSSVNVIKQPTFSEYVDACRAYGGVVVDKDEGLTCRKVYWKCNPNNPDGSVVDKERLLRLADAAPGDFFVIDQSYEHYTMIPAITDREAVSRPNVILIHSMTKRFCVPGLRIGHITANKDIMSRLKALRCPWSVGSLSVEAGCFLIRTGFRAIPDINGYLDEVRRLRDKLCSIDGVDVRPTRTNFMLARIRGYRVSSLKDYLVCRYGILIRDASNFSGLDGSFFRVAAQGREENDLLVGAVEEYMRSAIKG